MLRRPKYQSFIDDWSWKRLWNTSSVDRPLRNHYFNQSSFLHQKNLTRYKHNDVQFFSSSARFRSFTQQRRGHHCLFELLRHLPSTNVQSDQKTKRISRTLAQWALLPLVLKMILLQKTSQLVHDVNTYLRLVLPSFDCSIGSNDLVYTELLVRRFLRTETFVSVVFIWRE